MYLSGMLLFLLVIGCNAANETSGFLSGNEFEHLVELFSDQEIEVRQIPALPDQDLNALGVRTIGARMWLRSAARQWLESQAGCFLFVCFESPKLNSFFVSSLFILILLNCWFILSIFPAWRRRSWAWARTWAWAWRWGGWRTRWRRWRGWGGRSDHARGNGCPSAQVFFQDPFNWFVNHCVGKYILIAISGRIVPSLLSSFLPNGPEYSEA